MLYASYRNRMLFTILAADDLKLKVKHAKGQTLWDKHEVKNFAQPQKSNQEYQHAVVLLTCKVFPFHHFVLEFRRELKQPDHSWCSQECLRVSMLAVDGLSIEFVLFGSKFLFSSRDGGERLFRARDVPTRIMFPDVPLSAVPKAVAAERNNLVGQYIYIYISILYIYTVVPLLWDLPWSLVCVIMEEAWSLNQLAFDILEDIQYTN